MRCFLIKEETFKVKGVVKIKIFPLLCLNVHSMFITKSYSYNIEHSESLFINAIPHSASAVYGNVLL